MNRRRTRPNWFRIVLLCLLILGGAYVNRFIIATQPSPFENTPTPTLAPESFITEAEEAFTQGKGPWDAKVAKRFYDTVLSRGNTVDPAEGFRAFRGRDVDTNALMRDRGFPVR